MTTPRPLVLIVLDGWGIREETEGNAIAQASTPFYDSLLEKYPWTTLEASGSAVGLPEGKAGNSETGHMNLGAGYIVKQDVVRISDEIETGEFFKNEALQQVIHHLKVNDSSLHIMGLLSMANVHSEYKHLLALIEYANEHKLEKVYIHVFTDGRDSPPTVGIENITKLQEYISDKTGEIATIIGRYYAMDRDKRWDRTKLAYDLLTKGEGTKEINPIEALQHAYNRGETDEFIKPIVITVNDKPIANIKENDAILFFNFRTDRPRQLTRAFTLNDFDGFEREIKLQNVYYTTMTQYEKIVPVSGIIYPPFHVKEPFAKVISDAGLLQLHLAETEKVAHVTYFFNGGHEMAFPGEDRIHVPSNRTVATYDQAPEMSAAGITEAALNALEKNTYDFILINYANADMVGHSGDIEATKKAVEVIDKQLEILITKILDLNGTALITADHGNAEVLFNVQRNEVDTEHNIYPAPFICVSKDATKKELPRGVLSDVTTTMLELLHVSKSPEMTGQNLLQPSDAN